MRIPAALGCILALSSAAAIENDTRQEHRRASKGRLVSVVDHSRNVTYVGTNAAGVENFLDIRYGEDTSGHNRFRAPIPFAYPRSTVVNSTTQGHSCPQTYNGTFFGTVPADTGAKYQSEDCLNLRIARPVGTTASDKLPVLVWIYGGGDETGNIQNPLYSPDGLILSSVSHDLKVVFVSMNYRLNIFGFANAEILRSQNSLNNGLKDQRLVLEWIQSNIAAFGGDPQSVTLFGQSDGGTGVGLQLTAFGGQGKAPFTGAIMESGSASADPGVSGDFTVHSTMQVAKNAGCPTTNSTAMLECLGATPEHKLSNAVYEYEQAQANQPQDIFFPAVDGHFIPEAPSKLLRQGRYYKHIPVMAGFCADDDFIKLGFPHLTPKSMQELLSLYLVSEFVDAAKVRKISPQYVRAAQIYRDLDYACPAYYTVQQIAAHGGNAFAYEFNATAYAEIEKAAHATFLGVIHTSDIPFVFNEVGEVLNNTSYQKLATLVSGSWLQFAHKGTPTGAKDVIQDWTQAFEDNSKELNIRVIGGPNSGLKHWGEDNVFVKRCQFATTASFWSQLQT